MNSCCTQPIEKIAANQQQTGDDSCLITGQTSVPPGAKCPVSGTSGPKVQIKTLENLLKSESKADIQRVQYYYCAESACEVVYFSNESVPYFTKDDLIVKVFHKDSGDDVNVCYCFDWTRGKIREQIRLTGESTASIEIAKKVKAKLCMCDIKNPKGKCCLGDVNTVIKESLNLKIIERS